MTSHVPPFNSHPNPHTTTNPDKASSSSKETANSSFTSTSPEAMHANHVRHETEDVYHTSSLENVIVFLTPLNQNHLIIQLSSTMSSLQVQ